MNSTNKIEAEDPCQFCHSGGTCRAQHEIFAHLQEAKRRRDKKDETDSKDISYRKGELRDRLEMGMIDKASYRERLSVILNKERTQKAEVVRQELIMRALEEKASGGPSLGVGERKMIGVFRVGRLKCGPMVELYEGQELANRQSNCTLYSFSDSIFEGIGST